MQKSVKQETCLYVVNLPVHVQTIMKPPDVCSSSEGELKTPSVSIPKGTIVAVFYTFTVYALLFILVSATCDRSDMLQNKV